MRLIVGIVCAFVLVSAAQAGIIIDDFDDTASAGGFVDQSATALTPDVGDLNAERTIGVGVLAGDVIGTIDSNVSLLGHLTAEMLDVISNPPPTNGPLASMSVRYEFAELVDLSEGGTNNALLLDVRSLTGLTPPPRILFWLFDDTVPGLSYVYFMSPVPTSTEPFTLVIPFESLRDRGGGSIPATFTHVYELFIRIDANEFFGAPEELGWRIELDRIRVGVIPEPTTLTLLVTGLLLICPRRLR